MNKTAIKNFAIWAREKLMALEEDISVSALLRKWLQEKLE